jgi:hypothetical protein
MLTRPSLSLGHDTSITERNRGASLILIPPHTYLFHKATFYKKRDRFLMEFLKNYLI